MLTPMNPPNRHRPDGAVSQRHVAIEFAIVGLGLGLALTLLTWLEHWGRSDALTAAANPTPTLAQRTEQGLTAPVMRPADP